MLLLQFSWVLLFAYIFVNLGSNLVAFQCWLHTHHSLGYVTWRVRWCIWPTFEREVYSCTLFLTSCWPLFLIWLSQTLVLKNNVSGKSQSVLSCLIFMRYPYLWIFVEFSAMMVSLILLDGSSQGKKINLRGFYFFIKSSNHLFDLIISILLQGAKSPHPCLLIKIVGLIILLFL